MAPFYIMEKLSLETLGCCPQATQLEGGRDAACDQDALCLLGGVPSPCAVASILSLKILKGKAHAIITAFLGRGFGMRGKHGDRALPKS